MTPKIFDNLPLAVAASTLQNGVMSFGHREPDEKVAENRQNWLATFSIQLQDATLLRTIYGPDVRYDRIADIDTKDKGKGMKSVDGAVVCDAIFTKTPGQALFLPLADCGGIVIYDKLQKVLGLLHLGRHATFANLAAKAIVHLQTAYQSNPSDLFIWISPGISGESYLLNSFEFAEHPEWQPFVRQRPGGWLVDLQAYNIAAFESAGVPPKQIEYAEVDTATHPSYPSHYRFNTHNESHKAGRFAVVAQMEQE